MNIKEIVEGMTAPQVAQVIKDNFNEVDKDKANKTDVNASIAKLTETVETNKAETDAKIDRNKEETDGKLSELGSKVDEIVGVNKTAFDRHYFGGSSTYLISGLNISRGTDVSLLLKDDYDLFDDELRAVSYIKEGGDTSFLIDIKRNELATIALPENAIGFRVFMSSSTGNVGQAEFRVDWVDEGSLKKLDKDLNEKLKEKAEKIDFDLFISNIGYVAETPDFDSLTGEINTSGIVDSSSSYYKYTSPIHVSKGKTIVVKCAGSNISYLSLTDKNGSKYKPLWFASEGQNVFYLAMDDCYISISSSSKITPYIIDCNIVASLLDVIADTKELFSYKIQSDLDALSDLSDSNINGSNPAEKPSVDSEWDWQRGSTAHDGITRYHATEIQSRLVLLSPGRYVFNGHFQYSSGISFYDKNGDFKYQLTALGTWKKDHIYNIEFEVLAGAPYVSINCSDESWISKTSLRRYEEYVPNDVQMRPFAGEKAIVYTEDGCFSAKIGSNTKTISVRCRLNENLCNRYINKQLFLFTGNDHIKVWLECSTPTANLLPQKENAKNEENIKMVDFPMAVMGTKLHIERNNKLVDSIPLDGNVFRTLLRQTPPIIIRYIKKEGDVLSNLMDLKLYITENEGICNNLSIKKGSDILYSYEIDSSKELVDVYFELKEGIEAIEGYSFKVDFNDIEYLSIKDMVSTKESGLGFVTEFTSNYKEDGEKVYDTYPVFVEFMEHEFCKWQFNIVGDFMYIYLDGALVSKFYTNGVNRVYYGYKGIDVQDFGVFENSSANPLPIVKAFTAHSFYDAPTHETQGYKKPEWATSLHNAIGYLQMQKRLMDDLGYINVSAEDVGSYLLGSGTLPEKSYFIELDDLANLEGFKKMLSNEDEEGQRMMEKLKRTGLKLGFAMQLYPDKNLFEKIENGTATEEEMARLSVSLTNEQIQKFRCMINTFGWTVSVHEFVSPKYGVVDSTFDEFVASVRNSVKWFERMFGRSPMSYVTSGTGNSSPYFRRLIPMYGIPIVVQDKSSIKDEVNSTDNSVVYKKMYSFGSKSLAFNCRTYTGRKQDVEYYGEDFDSVLYRDTKHN